MSKEVLNRGINIKITEEQKDKLDKLVKESGTTLKGFILDSTIYSKEVDHKEQIDELERQLQTKELKAKALQKEVNYLKEGLKQSNKRIDEYSKHLDQEQQLHLYTSNRLLELESKEGSESNTNSGGSRGFWSRLFNK